MRQIKKESKPATKGPGPKPRPTSKEKKRGKQGW